MSISKKVKDMVGVSYGKLLVTEVLIFRRKAYCICRCECGNHTRTSAWNLQNDVTKSYGCSGRNGSPVNVRHGMYYTRVYSIYRNMMERCYGKKSNNYKNYGGRGITVCDEWKTSVSEFCSWALANGYADTLTIERKDVNAGYNHSNCTWVPMKQQVRNRRCTKTVIFQGVERVLGELCEEYHLPYKRVWARIARGWSLADALKTPLLASNACQLYPKKMNDVEIV